MNIYNTQEIYEKGKEVIDKFWFGNIKRKDGEKRLSKKWVALKDINKILKVLPNHMKDKTGLDKAMLKMILDLREELM